MAQTLSGKLSCKNCGKQFEPRVTIRAKTNRRTRDRSAECDECRQVVGTDLVPLESIEQDDELIAEQAIADELSFDPIFEFTRSPSRFHEDLARKWAAHRPQTLKGCCDVLELSQIAYKPTGTETQQERAKGERYSCALNAAIQAGLMRWLGVEKLYQLCRSENGEWSRKWLEHWAAKISLQKNQSLNAIIALPMNNILEIVTSNIGNVTEPKSSEGDRSIEQKRSSRGAKESLEAAFSLHHKYDAGSIGNSAPIGTNELQRLSGVKSTSTAKAFIDKWFGQSEENRRYSNGRINYKKSCYGDQMKLLLVLKQLAGESIAAMITTDDPEAIERAKLSRKLGRKM